MPAQKPQWFFQPRSSRNGASTRAVDTAPGLTSLLVAAGLIQDSPKVGAINEILDDVGMTLIPSRPEAPPQVRDPELARKLAQLPRVVTLAPARHKRMAAVVDAWVALQTLRAAVTPSGDRKRAKSPLDQDDVGQIAL